MSQHDDPPTFEELLPRVHRGTWVDTVERVRAAHHAGKSIEKEKAVQFGLGFLVAIGQVTTLTRPHSALLKEVLFSPGVAR